MNPGSASGFLILAVLGTASTVAAQVAQMSTTPGTAETVTTADKLVSKGKVIVDQADKNSGTVANAVVFGGGNSGEAIGSKRTGGGNQWGLDLYTGQQPRISIALDGNVGIGTGGTKPRTKLDIRSTDPAIELRNTNDGGRGAVVQNTYASTQMGMFAEQGGAGQVPGGGKRAFFGFNTDGKVGSLTNSMTTPSAPAFRNLLDDGQGNAVIKGSLNARSMPFVVYGEERNAVAVPKCSDFEMRHLNVPIPENGILVVQGHMTISGVLRAGGACADANSGTRADSMGGRFFLWLDKDAPGPGTTLSHDGREWIPDTFTGHYTPRLSVSAVIPVVRGQTVSLTMKGHNTTGAAVQERSLTAMFFPAQVQYQ